LASISRCLSLPASTVILSGLLGLAARTPRWDVNSTRPGPHWGRVRCSESRREFLASGRYPPALRHELATSPRMIPSWASSRARSPSR
jgi:hypothetical protein